jgi:hypothetical protein
MTSSKKRFKKNLYMVASVEVVMRRIFLLKSMQEREKGISRRVAERVHLKKERRRT